MSAMTETQRAENWASLTADQQKNIDSLFGEIARSVGIGKGHKDGIHPMPVSASAQGVLEKIIASGLMSQEEVVSYIDVVPNAHQKTKLNDNFKCDAGMYHYALDVRAIPQEVVQRMISVESVIGFSKWRDQHIAAIAGYEAGGPGYKLDKGEPTDGPGLRALPITVAAPAAERVNVTRSF